MDTAVVGCRPNTSSLLKEPFTAFSSLLFENPGLRCATGRLPKDRILQQAAGHKSGQANSD